MIVDWIPADGMGGKKEFTVDPTKHCIYMPGSKSLTPDERPNDGLLFIGLERGKTYTVTAAGEAFMTDHTGVDADPFPGVVLFYGTDEEDCYAIRQTVLAPGKSVTFRSPWNIAPIGGRSDVYLQAFFLDPAPNDPNRGSYTLTIEESGEQAAAEHTLKAPFDGIITKRGRSVVTHTYNRSAKYVNIDSSHSTTDTASPDHPDTKAPDQAKPKPYARPASRRGALAGPGQHRIDPNPVGVVGLPFVLRKTGQPIRIGLRFTADRRQSGAARTNERRRRTGPNRCAAGPCQR